MEVVVQRPSSPTMDNFDFGGNMGSIYQSAPSSPKGFGNYYLSAPASPSRMSELYSEFEYYSSASPSSFEAANKIDDDDDENKDYSFAFYVNRDQSDKSSRSAEELFHGGKIKPLSEPRSSSKDPSVAEQKRGRERERTSSSTTTLSSSNSGGRRVTRSHSPYRKSWEVEQQQQQQQPRSSKEESSASVLSSSTSSKGSKRWWLKDFLLFRSASEGRGSSKDALKKYYKKNSNEEVKGSSSFRSSDSSRSRKGPLSAHEFHYAMKRQESEDMKKRTFLPYRQGILGRLAGFGI